MKVSEIPEKIFREFADMLAAQTSPDEHLGGTRITAPMLKWMGYIVLADHPNLNCSSCSIFREYACAIRGLFPICSVQVGPHSIEWDARQGAHLQELKASFSTRESVLVTEERLIRAIRDRFIALKQAAEPVMYTDLAMDLVE